MCVYNSVYIYINVYIEMMLPLFISSIIMIVYWHMPVYPVPNISVSSCMVLVSGAASQFFECAGCID